MRHMIKYVVQTLNGVTEDMIRDALMSSILVKVTQRLPELLHPPLSDWAYTWIEIADSHQSVLVRAVAPVDVPLRDLLGWHGGQVLPADGVRGPISSHPNRLDSRRLDNQRLTSIRRELLTLSQHSVAAQVSQVSNGPHHLQKVTFSFSGLFTTLLYGAVLLGWNLRNLGPWAPVLCVYSMGDFWHSSGIGSFIKNHLMSLLSEVQILRLY